MKYVVDVQGFKTTFNEFIFKEVAIIPVEEDAMPLVYMFEPPYPWKYLLEKSKSENRWLRENFHGLRWNSGNIPYDQIRQTFNNAIMDDWATVYVKGAEKVGWITRELRDTTLANFVNIEDLGCPSLKKLPVEYGTCSNHQAPYLDSMCAFRNAQALKKWLLENKEKTKVQMLC